MTKTEATVSRKRPRALWLLVALLVIEGVGGLYGGGALIAAPDGRLMRFKVEWLRGSPFGSYLIPGIILFVVLGVFPLVAAYGVIRLRRWAWWSSVAVGIGMAVWIAVEVAIVNSNAALTGEAATIMKRLQIFVGVLAGLIIAVSALPSVRRSLLRHSGG